MTTGETSTGEIVSTAEATAIQVATQMVNVAFPNRTATAGSTSTKPGLRWEQIDMKDEDAVKARLEEMADLIGNLKRRILSSA